MKKIRLVISDVDGTLIDSKRILTRQAKDAVVHLKESGVLFAITSGRPPRGLHELIFDLKLETPVSAFNGGLIMDPSQSPYSTLQQRILPQHLIESTIQTLEKAGHDVWIYRGVDWFVRDSNAPHVAKEMATVKFEPKVVSSFKGLTEQVLKIVGINDDSAALSRTGEELHQACTGCASVLLSQPYYLDVTHPEANKGAVVQFLSHFYKIDESEIATLGDMPNDIKMFEHSGLSIAMGNAAAEVKKAAKEVTISNDEEGFAKAIMKFF